MPTAVASGRSFYFPPQAGQNSACLSCGWHDACTEDWQPGPALDFDPAFTDSGRSVFFRAFAFIKPGDSSYVGYTEAFTNPGEICKEVDVRIWDTEGGNPLGMMRYMHTELTNPQIVWLYASEEGYENEYAAAVMADDEKSGCKDAGYWTLPHLHEYHGDGTSVFLLRDGGDCAGRYPCGPQSVCVYYDPQDWENDWARALCINDTDCDGWTDAAELYLGTDPLDACPDHSSHDAWPLDINNDGVITVSGDVLNFRGRLSAEPGNSEWWQRLDLNTDGVITVSFDVFLYRGRIQEHCI